ncbi:MAG: class I adenylate-forming enzyme family protein, partial [Pseudomonadota bacterium]
MRFRSTGNLGDVVATLESGSYTDRLSKRRWSLPEMDAAAAALAGWFGERYDQGDRIGILGLNGADFMQTYLGVMRAGLVAVPINHKLPGETVAYILADSQCRAVFHHREFQSLLPSELSAFAFEDNAFSEARKGEAAASVHPDKGVVAEILYTSGSTGRPKGVPLDHHGQLWALELFLDAIGDVPQKTIIVAPTYHMNGLFFTTVALAKGWHTWSMPRFEARVFLSLVDEERISMLSGIPTMFAMMSRERDLIETLDLTSVTSVAIGSAPLTDALVETVQFIFPNAAVTNSYGTTESGPAMFGPHPDGLSRPVTAIGYPYPGVELRLEDGGPDWGRLLTRTPATLSNYLNLPEVTAKKITDGWYDTGDIVRRDSEGFYHFVGRADD